MATNTPAPARALDFDKLPDSAYIDVRAVAGIHDISVPTTWRWSANGLLPPPEKLGPGTTRWNVGALRRHRAKVLEKDAA
ncbi:AlpA family transcriptional regulator [Variovorax sp. YR216]|uniref:helix-turn-helix transcriptional regulator n=1 Tax=Variovorax sp. YR216 TaxID=1882828 RepID=UPI00089815D1|nr:hypothetical protein [Variovorax sp. YR216]SEA76500.1 hypothetical protein SAMN05444680_103483 [Variovorax sp. YR216]